MVSATGVTLLARLQPDSGYGTLLVAMLLWGIGMGLLTPAVVAAALDAVPLGRAGLASGVNNTARQAGGAIGIAAFGALAGSAADGDSFTSGLHTAGLVTAALFLTATLATLALIGPGRDNYPRRLRSSAIGGRRWFGDRFPAARVELGQRAAEGVEAPSETVGRDKKAQP